MQQSGATAREIADKMKLPLKVVKDILGEDSINEKFTKKDFDRNEDENEHTKNSYELAKMFGDTSEKSRMTRLYNKTRKVGSFLTKAENDFVTMIQSKYYRRLREELELDELQNYSRQLKDPSKEMLVVDKDGKVSVIDKSEFEKYKRQGFMAAEDIGEDGPCWKTHKQVGMKKKNGRMVPNCVPKEELDNDDKPLVKKVADMLKKASKKHASQSKMLDKAVNESVKVEGGPPARDDSGKMGPGSGAHNHGKSSSASPKKSSVSKALLNKDGKPSIGKLKNAIDDVNNTRSMAGNKFDITDIEYR